MILIAIAILVASAVWGLVRLAQGWTTAPWAIWVNLFWVSFDLLVLSVIIQAARYQGPPTQQTTA